MSARIRLGPDIPFVFPVTAAGYGDLTRGRLRGPDLEAPYRGVRKLASAPQDRLGALRDYVPLLRPGDRFSHESAALVWDAPLPAPAVTVHVSSTGRGEPRARGVAGHRAAGVTVVRSGLPVSHPATLFLELAGRLPLDDLVAVADHLVLVPFVGETGSHRPFATVEELRAAAESSRGRHVRIARTAADLVRVGAASRPETRIRLLLIRAGLPEPELNLDVFTADGHWIGRFDLVWRRWRIIVEYDGDQHRTSTRQYERDIRRFDLAVENGWTVIRVRSHGLFVDPSDTVARVRRAFARAGA